ncbi:MAG TPA: hypothetical protein VGE34_02675 [Candidatus Saccharimonadales bacterium]
MAFNHYAKIKRILETYDDWYIVRINKPTSAQKFNGETVRYNHYYRIYSKDNQPIKFCKFQQIERFAKAMNIPVEMLPISEG